VAVGVDVRELLEAAVSGINGQTRPGQVQMAEAVNTSMHDGSHLLVQAGTGTGKSLGYLVPALLHAIEDRRVVVSTATLALQSQLVDRDVPALLDATEKLLPRRPTYAIQKGRNNYACLHRIREGAPDDDGMLIDVPPPGPIGQQVLELREWAEQQLLDGEAGDRDHAPSHQYQAWQQVAIAARECLGAQKCPYGEECFAEKAKEEARKSDIVITNHALLSIDAFENRTVLPEHDVVIVDEAHELPARVTGAAGDELSPQMVERAAKRARRFVDDDKADDLIDASDAGGRSRGDRRGRDRGVERSGARGGGAGPRRGSRAVLRPQQEDRRQGRRPRRRQAAVEGRGQGDLRRLRARGRVERRRRRLDGRPRAVRPRAPDRAADGGRPAARARAEGSDRRAHLRHPHARR
jgi:ATP-dependent DNA helicase DinG